MFLDLIFPPTCAYCGKPGTKLCSKCQSKIEQDTLPICIICENPTINGVTHKFCIKSNPFAPDAYIFSYPYNHISKQIINKAKSKNYAYRYVESILNDETLNIIKTTIKASIIVPIPPSKSSNRLKDIVFFMSELLSNHMNIPIINVLKNRSDQTQKELNKLDRAQNAIEKFHLSEKSKLLIKNESILLLDDVNTTGSTLIMASKLLKATGAKNISCYTLCKDLRYN